MRHPYDPDPIASTKAVAVLWLGAVGMVTGPLLGGLIPAGFALLLARQAKRDLMAAGGFLLGGRKIRIGVGLAWTGILLAITTLVIVMIIGLLSLADQGSGRDFAPTVN